MMLPLLSTLRSVLGRFPDDERCRTESAIEPDPIDPLDVYTGSVIGVRRVGAWTGSSSMASPRAIRDAVNFAKAVGLGRLDVIVNDHSAWRAPTRFTTYPTVKIVALVHDARAAGLDVHLMSWVMPHRDYLLGARDALLPLLERTGASSLQFDAEEPWTQATKPMPYGDAAELVRALFPRAQTMEDELNVMVGVNAIGYAPAEKVGPLLSVADYVVPQCYSTSTSKLDPSTVVARLMRRWRKVFTFKPTCNFVVGLAAYRQSGIPGVLRGVGDADGLRRSGGAGRRARRHLLVARADPLERGGDEDHHVPHEQGDTMRTSTLPSITGVLTVAQTDSGHVVTVTIEPGPTNRTWSASCKFWSAPEPDVLDNAARRMLVAATQKWLAEGGRVHLVLTVEGLDAGNAG